MIEKIETKADLGELKELTDMANKMITLKRKIGEREDELKKLSEQYRTINEITLPEKMMAIGLLEIKLEDGTRLLVETFYNAKIPDNKADEAFQWLEDHDCGSLIKNKVDVTLGKGENEVSKEIVDFLTAKKVAFTHKTSVHPMTLKAFVREQIESGNELDQELFGVYIGNKIKVK